MSKAGAFLIGRVNEYAREQTWSLHQDLPTIALAELGYDAGMIGAAGLAWQQGERPSNTSLSYPDCRPSD